MTAKPKKRRLSRIEQILIDGLLAADMPQTRSTLIGWFTTDIYRPPRIRSAKRAAVDVGRAIDRLMVEKRLVLTRDCAGAIAYQVGPAIATPKWSDLIRITDASERRWKVMCRVSGDEVTSTITGGSSTVKGVPKPHIWLNDQPDLPIIVTVSVTKYYGVGQHWWVRLKGPRDMLWDPRQRAWLTAPPDMPKSREAWSADENFTDMAAGEAWAAIEIHRRYPGREVLIEYSPAGSETNRWFYRDGD